MQLYTTMTLLWRSVSFNVVTNSNWSCLVISAPKVHWTVQPTAARRSGRFNKMHGALRSLHVSLNNAVWELSGNDRKGTTTTIDSPNLNTMDTSCLESEALSYFEVFIRSPKQFWIRSCIGEDMGQFSASPIDKPVPSFTTSLMRVCEGW